MITSEKIDQLIKALDGFHEKSNLVKATKENPFLKNKYADYNTIVTATKPDLLENGLRVKQSLTSVDGATGVYTLLLHVSSGQFMSDVAPIVHKPNDPQAQGSGVTYMKRYSYVAMLDLLVDADDDGNLANDLGKTAEKNKQVEAAIALIEKTTSEEELKTTFMGLGNLNKDKRVIAAKDEQKAKLNI